MLKLEELQKRIVKQFPRTELLSDSSLRFVKEKEGHPYAVCYVEIGDGVLADPSSLDSYVEKFIAPRYFEGATSLQWNTYLYFVAQSGVISTPSMLQAKGLIESDRRYARKFVIAEDKIEEILEPLAIRAPVSAKIPSVLSIWENRLAEAGLEGAILDDDDFLPKRLEKILAATPGEPRQSSLVGPAVSAPPFIRKFELRDYRTHPLQREFEFGTVNLIYGPNAAGKTSLLEAIELFYCGRNKRGAERASHYEIAASFEDGEKKIVDDRRNLHEFRDQNLLWYGQAEVKTNNLFQSFAKFNFLDTDAAVHISEATSGIEDDLAKLLIGPDASKTWHTMLRVLDALETRLRDLSKLNDQIQDSIAQIEREAATLSSIPKKSDALRDRLITMLGDIGWSKEFREIDEEAAGTLVGSLVELGAIATQLCSLTWVPSPITVMNTASFLSDASSRIELTETLFESVNSLVAEIGRQEAELSRNRDIFDLLKQARSAIEAGVLAQQIRNDRLVAGLKRMRAVTAGIGIGDILDWYNSDPKASNTTLSDLARSSSEALLKAETTLKGARDEYARFAQLREHSFNLAQQLRAIAHEILEGQDGQDVCPLCHTTFPDGTLKDHLSIGVNAALEQAGAALLERTSRAEQAYALARKISAIKEDLLTFRERQGFSKDTPTVDAISALLAHQATMVSTESELDHSEEIIALLAKDGVSFKDFVDTLSKINILGCRVSADTVTNELVSQYEDRVSEGSYQLSHFARLVSDHLEQIEALGFDLPSNLSLPQEQLSLLKERVAITESLLSSLRTWDRAFPWPDFKSVSELLVQANSLRTIAAELSVSLGEERANSEITNARTQRKVELEKQRDEIAPTIDRFSRAKMTLTAIIRDYPLNAAIDSALRKNRASIEATFTRIHSPREFAGLGDAISTLRRLNGESASLTEISTGQRAAFALSIFLAQNSQLTGAPPVMLIDDPIAHVDDLNCLAFLDYLRDVAIQGRRQIFFATANEKMATLFQRKFDFLGDKLFRRVFLTREKTSSQMVH